MRSTPEITVAKYLDRLVHHDWDGVTECLHPEVVRVGPFDDAYSPRETYVKYLSSVLPALVNYEMTIQRVMADGPVVMVQLTEAMEFGGSEDVTREVLVFETGPESLITRIDIFIQRAPT